MAITWWHDLFKKRAKTDPSSEVSAASERNTPDLPASAAQPADRTVQALMGDGGLSTSLPDPRQALQKGLLTFSLPQPDLDAGKGGMDGKPGIIPPGPRMPIASDPQERSSISDLMSRIDPEALKALLEVKDLPDIKPPSDKSVRNF